MSRLPTLLVVAAFVALAVFGFLPMHDGAGHMNGCVASAAAATPCPAETGTLAFLNFHASAFQAFSTAIPLAAALLAAFALLILATPLPQATLQLRAVPFARQTPASALFPLPARILRWLSLRENSPSAF